MSKLVQGLKGWKYKNLLQLNKMGWHNVAVIHKQNMRWESGLPKHFKPNPYDSTFLLAGQDAFDKSRVNSLETPGVTS